MEELEMTRPNQEGIVLSGWADAHTLLLVLSRFMDKESNSFDKDVCVAVYNTWQGAEEQATLGGVVSLCDRWLEESEQRGTPVVMHELGYSTFKAFYPRARREINEFVADQLQYEGADLFKLLGVAITSQFRIAVKCMRGAARRRLEEL